MDRAVTPRRNSARNTSAPVNYRIGGRLLDGSLTSRHRRVSRLDSALEDARRNSERLSELCTPRSTHPQTSIRSDNNAVDQLQSVFDRVEQRNNALTQPLVRIPILSTTQLEAAKRAVQAFVDEMRHVADTAGEQTKSDLTQMLTADILASRANSTAKIMPPLPIVRQQNHEADSLDHLDNVACWYAMGKEIGRGTFGRVRFATHRLSGTPVAIKSYARLHGARSCLPVDAIGKRMIGDSVGDALEWRRVRQEVNVLSQLRAHPNIMRFVEVFETQTRINVITEFVRGCSLCDVLRRASGQRLPEIRAKRIFQQLVVGVEALHAQHVIHRDLKLENVLLDERLGHATIIDFGFSGFEEFREPQILDPANNSPHKQITLSKKKNFCGTPAYMAPEVVAREQYDGRPVDIWSLGVILYVMLCGKFPFQGVSFHQLYQKLRSGVHQLVLPPALSTEAHAVLQSVLTVDPAKRPSASELCYCSWLQTIETPQTSPQRQSILSLSFEAWIGKHQKFCETLTELYGMQLNPSDLDQPRTGSRRHNRLNAFLRLAIAVSSHHFQQLVEALPPKHLLSTEGIQPQEPDIECTNSQKSLDDIESTSTRHKRQLEKLIGLMKTSLTTR